MMERHVMWSPWAAPGLEHLLVKESHDQVVASGWIIGVSGSEPFRAQYEIHSDQHWRVCMVQTSVMSRCPQTLSLLTDGKGTWTTDAGAELPFLQGCLDVDISATPFTNTLPIRRLALHPGESAALNVVYIAIPDLRVSAADQRYTCLEVTADGGRYLYESLERGVAEFSAELSVDRDGLVEDYPGLFKRVGTW
jgi:hypothetical protein